MTNMGKMSTDAWASVQLSQHLDVAAERGAEAARQRLVTTARELRLEPVALSAPRAMDSGVGPAPHVTATAMEHSPPDRPDARAAQGGTCADRPAAGQPA